VLKIRPPLPFAKEHVDQFTDALGEVFGELDARG
jgi:4-aminobutyrate aminotransferase-like enzyme